jgi:hypothetical protein
MQTLDVKAEQLRQRLFEAARQLAEFEHQQSFRIPVPGSDPLRFIAYGTRVELDAIGADGVAEYMQADTGAAPPRNLGDSITAKLQRDPDSAPKA